MYENIVAEYPELKDSSAFYDGTIILQDDSDGYGPYIAKWEYEKPLPAGMKIGKDDLIS